MRIIKPGKRIPTRTVECEYCEAAILIKPKDLSDWDGCTGVFDCPHCGFQNTVELSGSQIPLANFNSSKTVNPTVTIGDEVFIFDLPNADEFSKVLWEIKNFPLS